MHTTKQLGRVGLLVCILVQLWTNTVAQSTLLEGQLRILEVSPDVASSQLNIGGLDFGTAGVVSLDGVNLTPVNWSNTIIVIPLPDVPAGSYELRVTRAGSAPPSLRRDEFEITLGAGTGTVLSVESGTGLTGGPITTSGTLELDTAFTDLHYATIEHQHDVADVSNAATLEANSFTGNQHIDGNLTAHVTGSSPVIMASVHSQTATPVVAVIASVTSQVTAAHVALKAAVDNVAGIAAVFENNGGGNLVVGRVNSHNKFRIDGIGNAFFLGSVAVGGGVGFAEMVEVAGERDAYQPGDVLVIDDSTSRRVTLARDAYSTLVVGIYSTKPGILLTEHESDDPTVANEIPLAVLGIVPCKVTTLNGPIARGDLLVTSPEPGHAMRGTDRSQLVGAIVGKALEPMENDAGVILVLVTLQ